MIPRLGAAALGLALAGCAAAQQNTKKAVEKKPMISNEWQGLAPGVSTPAEAQAVFGKPEKVVTGVVYGAVDRLEMHSYDTPQGSLFYRDGRLAVFVLVPKPKGDFPLDIKAWEEQLGKPDTKLASIRGKNHRLWLWGEKGLTATEDAGVVNLVEMFPAMRAEDYEKHLYKKPPVFVK